MFQTKVGQKIKTHILLSAKFFRQSFLIWDNVDKNVQPGRPQMKIWNMSICMLDTHDSKHTLRLCNTYCFSKATMVAPHWWVKRTLSVLKQWSRVQLRSNTSTWNFSSGHWECVEENTSLTTIHTLGNCALFLSHLCKHIIRNSNHHAATTFQNSCHSQRLFFHRSNILVTMNELLSNVLFRVKIPT